MPLIYQNKGYSDLKNYQNVLELTFNKISVFKSNDFTLSENFNINTFCTYCQVKYIGKNKLLKIIKSVYTIHLNSIIVKIFFYLIFT